MQITNILAVAILISSLAPGKLLAALPSRIQPARIGLPETMDGCGLRIKTFKDCKAIPSKALDCRTIVNPGTGESVEFYPGPDFWRQEQFVGQWSGTGVSITLYELKYPVATLPMAVSRADFTTWAGANKLPAAPDIPGWVKAVSGLDVTPTAAKLKGEGDAVITAYNSSGGSNYRECYLVQSAKAGRTLFGVYDFDRETVDVARSKSAIKSSVQSLAFFAMKTVAVKQQPNSAVSGQRNYSLEYLASKQKVIDSIRNLKGWWFLETENYVLVSNQKNRQAVEMVKKDMERARTGFEAVYPLLRPLKAVSVIRMPATRDEYLAYVTADIKWSSGVWMPAKNELVVSDADGGDNRDKANRMRQVIFHEGFHQYLSYAAGTTDVWFNEGHAQFFEGMDFSGATFRVNCLADAAARVMRVAANGRGNLQQMFAMSRDDFYVTGGGSQNEARADHYALAWGIVYYMNKGALCAKKTERYAEIPLRYYLTIIRTHDPKAAMVAALEGVDVDKLERDFQAFWKDPGTVRRSVAQPFVKERKELLKKLQKMPEFALSAPAAAAAGE